MRQPPGRTGRVPAALQVRSYSSSTVRAPVGTGISRARLQRVLSIFRAEPEASGPLFNAKFCGGDVTSPGAVDELR